MIAKIIQFGKFEEERRFYFWFSLGLISNDLSSDCQHIRCCDCLKK